MAIKIQEKFEVEAPIDAVWRFMIDPEQVVTCLPGAQLDETIDERTFLGTIKVKVGAVSASYQGKAQFTQLDAVSHTIELAGEGREKGGGNAKGTLVSRVTSVSVGVTAIEADMNVDLTGRIMQVGRGMIQGVSKQIFKQFVQSMKDRLETVTPAAGADASTAAPAATPVPAQNELRLLPVLLRALREAIARFIRRLAGRPVS